MINSEDISPFFDKVLNFLSYRPRSEYEINYYMLRKGWPEEIKEEIISKLKHLKLIDDKEFARQWLNNRTCARPAGRSLIKMELRKKGVAKEIIEELLKEDRSTTAEEILAEKVAKKRLARLENLPPIEQKNKLFGLLSRRGFSSETAVSVIDKLVKKE